MRDEFLKSKLQGFLPNTLQISFFIMDGDTIERMQTFALSKSRTTTHEGEQFSYFNFDITTAEETASLYEFANTGGGNNGSKTLAFILHNYEEHHVEFPTIWSIRNPYSLANRTALRGRVIKFKTRSAARNVSDSGGEQVSFMLQGTWASGRKLQPFSP